MKDKVSKTLKVTGKAIIRLPKTLWSLVKKLLKLIVRLLSYIKFLQRPINFLRDAFQELKLVTWLSRRDTVKFSLLILLFMVLTAVAIAGLDLLFFKGLKFLLS